MSPLNRLFGYARPYRGLMLLALVGMVLYAAGSTGLTMLIKPIVDRTLPFKQNLAVMAWAIVGLYLVKGLGSYLSSYLLTDVGQRVVMDLRNALYKHILGQSAGFFAQRTTGQLMSRINNDVGQVQQVVSETLGDLARESLTLVGLIAWMFYLDARLTIVCLTSAPLIVYPLIRLGQRVRRTTRRSQEALGLISHISAEAFTGHRIVKAFGTESHETDKFNRAGAGLYRTNMKVTAALSSLPPLMEFIGGIGMALALVYGSEQVAGGHMQQGDFFSFMAALLLMYSPAKKLSRVNANLQQAMAASERIFEMLDTHTEVKEQPGAQPLQPFQRAIEFREVGFGYDEGPGRILRGVSLSVAAGQMLAIVGRSGAGKTTLVNLLPRFYDVSSGAILVDGVDIRHVTLASLRKQIGIVTQETVLFDDTIATNIAYGSPDASRAQIESAARAANAHGFISNELAEGYETMIGERGQRLSGGQRQRIAIARAILKNAPILVLDEATSALDSESELLVQEALANLMLNRTSFVIAHRLSTIRRADAIIVLERGHVVEIGRHEDLVGRPGGTYAALYQMQLLEEGRREGRRDGRREGRWGGAAGAGGLIKSMTGFAALTREDARGTVSVTIRALNHRHLDLQLRMPQSLAAIESEVRAQVARRVARGRVELSVSLQVRQLPGVDVEFNEEFGRALSAALDQARARGLVAGALTPGDLLRLPQALTIRERQADADAGLQEELAARTLQAIEDALADLDVMRGREGDHLRADLDERRAAVAGLVERVAAAADEGRAAMEQRLADRVRELRTELQADEVAVAQEIVRMAARSDISEEVTRFRGHVSHWQALADGPEACGRKLDFLLQEMNREVNTMGSKADGLRVSELIIAAKAELEKMREQVQNAE